jgi:hypothetical protein
MKTKMRMNTSDVGFIGLKDTVFQESLAVESREKTERQPQTRFSQRSVRIRAVAERAMIKTLNSENGYAPQTEFVPDCVGDSMPRIWE